VSSRLPYAAKRAFRAAFTRPLLDARGRQVPLYDSRGRMFFDDPSVDFPQRDFERVYRRLVPGFSFRRNPPLQLAVAGLFLGIGAYTFWLSRWLAIALCDLGMAACAVAGARATRRRFWGVDPVAIGAALVAEGRCASCAYKLTSVPPDPDGITICPECSAAWRLPLNPPPTLSP
jgi:hypothetical protein